jgi:beta-glucosidase
MAEGRHSLIRQMDAASTVLLKNTNNVLPLKKPKSIAIIGSGAAANPDGPNAYVLLSDLEDMRPE